MRTYFHCSVLSARGSEDRWLYQNAVLSLPESSLAVLTGPSGCGKSTLLAQVVGLKQAGTVERVVAGVRYPDNSLPSWRSRVTLMAQDAPVLQGDLARNLDFPYGLRHSEGRGFHEGRAGELLERVGLGGIALHRDAGTLSGGERRRLALVRALLWNPLVILADEPLAGLDDDMAAACLALLRDFARRPGKAVLCVLHGQETGNGFDLRFSLTKQGIEAS